MAVTASGDTGGFSRLARRSGKMLSPAVLVIMLAASPVGAQTAAPVQPPAAAQRQAPAAAAPAAPNSAAPASAAPASAAAVQPPVAPISNVPDAASDAALVERGAYLARAADCMPCHTGNKDKPFAGALGLNTPFGVLYSVNITSDRKTGIGSWTFDDFKGAVHNGIRKDGAFLYPAMPFDAYTAITDADLKALWAYVRRIPPVEAPNPENGLGFPFNVRLGLLAWRELFFTPATFQPTAGKNDEWNRGAYLVEALGHCSDCHSPRNIMGAIKGKEAFTGANIDGFYAPAIDPQTLTKAGWTPDALTQFLKTGSAPGKTAVFGPMAEVIRNSTSFMTDADVKAMVTYLFDAPPPQQRPDPHMASPLTTEQVARASKLYVDNCMECHQPHGTGKAGLAPNLAGNPAVNATEPYNLLMATLGGLTADGDYGAMPSFAGRLGDTQIADLANYIRTSWGNTASPNVTPEMVASWRTTAAVPDYGTQAASAFKCPEVGGGPSQSGPDPATVTQLSGMLKAGNNNIRELATMYRGATGDDDVSNTIDALIASYCPVVAAKSMPDWQKTADLKTFAMRVSVQLADQTAAVTIPPVNFIWAAPAGKSLVAREPDGSMPTLTCPANDGKLVPQALVNQATTLIGTPKPPMSATSATDFASKLRTANAKARPADLANALISAYCPSVKAAPGATMALQRSWLESFGEQVIETLQITDVAAK